LKQIDRYLIHSFIPPFIVTFGIAMFVLIMQFLWLYIDEIMGKGISFFELIELMYYLSLSLVPTALPIGVLISSVMVLGNIAERYELSSFKSAGVPLFRVMLPILVIGLFISLFSFFCSDRLIPWANLKFYSRFYDIRKQKPTLAIVPGIFLDNFAGYTLRIGKKELDNKTIHDILIYDTKTNSASQINQIVAKDGQMFNTPDQQYMVMLLKNGTQYQEIPKNSEYKGFQFVRTNFKKWQKLFDMAELETGKTDENLFKSHQKMLSSNQLLKSIDSIYLNKKARLDELGTLTHLHFYPKIDSLAKAEYANQQRRNDNLIQQVMKIKHKTLIAQSKVPASQEKILESNFYNIKKNEKTYDYVSLVNKAESEARSMQSSYNSTSRTLDFIKEQLNNFYYELHLKYAIALICIVFIFIGAPMGAIVQKGGFGFPILISILFFMLYVVLQLQFQSLNKSQSINPILAAWMPVFILAPIGMIISYRAMNDYKILQMDVYVRNIQNFIKKYYNKFSKKKNINALDNQV
jgi:lipopolysaccharide export system permease protein